MKNWTIENDKIASKLLANFKTTHSDLSIVDEINSDILRELIVMGLEHGNMKRVNKLFKYTYHTYCQGTRDRGEDYALLYVPDDASFSNNRSTLFNEKHIEGVYEIDIHSVEDVTIKW